MCKFVINVKLIRVHVHRLYTFVDIHVHSVKQLAAEYLENHGSSNGMEKPYHAPVYFILIVLIIILS